MTNLKCLVCSTLMYFYCLFTPLAVQNTTKENTATGSSDPLHDSSSDCSTHQLHDLQSGPTIRHVWQPEISCTGESEIHVNFCAFLVCLVLLESASRKGGFPRKALSVIGFKQLWSSLV